MRHSFQKASAFLLIIGHSAFAATEFPKDTKLSSLPGDAGIRILRSMDLESYPFYVEGKITDMSEIERTKSNMRYCWLSGTGKAEDVSQVFNVKMDPVGAASDGNTGRRAQGFSIQGVGFGICALENGASQERYEWLTTGEISEIFGGDLVFVKP